MSAAKPIIVVTGATGAQGSSVVKHLLRDGRWHVRGVTRDPTSAKAATLVKQNAGVELVKADLSDLKSFVAATVGAAGVFIVTEYWETHNEDAEVAQGKNAIDACVANKVQHVVFSALPGVNFLTNGRLKVPHFDGKWRIAMLLRASGLSHSLVFVPFYYENYLTVMAPAQSKENPNEYTFTVPTGGKRYPQGSVGEIGGFVAPLFASPATYNGKLVDGWTTLQTTSEAASQYAAATGRVAKVYEPKLADFAKFPFPGAKDIADMFEWYQLQDDRRRAGNRGDASNVFHELGIRDSDLISGARTLYPASPDLPAVLRTSSVARS